ncbi:MAG: NADH-quinone oxidoreductase subunit K [Candidatus Heimdallarchaeota archaeon]|nr:NADH-quinone oxidoreductase subunit K [Candidatus Heimdallarchaeota archaeon]
MNIDLAFWLASSFLLFIVGLYGLITKRDALRIIIGIEIMVIAANLVFIGIAYNGDVTNPLAQTYAILSLGIGGSIIGIALAFLVKIYEKHGSVFIGELKELKW